MAHIEPTNTSLQAIEQPQLFESLTCGFSQRINFKAIGDELLAGGADFVFTRFHLITRSSAAESGERIRQEFLQSGAAIRARSDSKTGFVFEIPLLEPGETAPSRAMLSEGRPTPGLPIEASKGKALWARLFSRERIAAQGLVEVSTISNDGPPASDVEVIIAANPSYFPLIERLASFQARDSSFWIEPICFAVSKKSAFSSGINFETVAPLGTLGLKLNVTFRSPGLDLSWLSQIRYPEGFKQSGSLDRCGTQTSIFDDSTFWKLEDPTSKESVSVARGSFQVRETELHISDPSNPALFGLWKEILAKLCERGIVTSRTASFPSIFKEYSSTFAPNFLGKQLHCLSLTQRSDHTGFT